jgi:hypothetical protein
MTTTTGPVPTTGLSGAVQLTGVTCAVTYAGACTTVGVPVSQDLLLYFAQAKTTLDIGITLTGTVTSTGAAALYANSGVTAGFPILAGTSTGLMG